MSNWLNHIKHLEVEHHKLDKQIDGLESTGVYSDTLLENLKKQRLRLKDEITKIKHQHNQVNT